MIKEKFTKNIMLGELRERDKTKLLNSKILIAGCNELGTKILANLAYCGIGTIGIFDSINRPETEKIISAKIWLEKNYKDINVKTYNEEINKTNGEKIVREYNLLIDCFDDYQSKFLLNELAVNCNVPMVHGVAAKNYGHATIIIPHKTPCLACIFPNVDKETKMQEEAAAFAVNAIGAIMSQSAVNQLLGIKDDLQNTLLTYSSENMKLEEIKLSFNPDCRACGKK